MLKALFMAQAIIQSRQMTVGCPRTNAGFHCFVCGTRFGSSGERIEHLEKDLMGACIISVLLEKQRMLDDVEA
jgi:hypothetical protein